MKKILSLFVLVLTLVGCDAVNQVDAPTLSGLVETESELFYDFGDVNIEGGFVDTTFSFVNDSDEDLTVVSLATSCGCTRAEVVLNDGSKSPVFGMHTKTEWNEVVPAGESFEVLVTYDPMAHGPDAVGPISRSVIMTTSSEENGRIAVIDPESGYAFTQMNIKGRVLYAQDFLESNQAEDEL